VGEAVLGQRAVGDAAHEGVHVLGLPEAGARNSSAKPLHAIPGGR